MDVRKLVEQGFWIESKGVNFFQTVAYENLPIICLNCGRIGHYEGSCNQKEEEGSSLKKKDEGSREVKEEKLLGSWVQVQRRRRKNFDVTNKKGGDLKNSFVVLDNPTFDDERQNGEHMNVSRMKEKSKFTSPVGRGKENINTHKGKLKRPEFRWEVKGKANENDGFMEIETRTNNKGKDVEMGEVKQVFARKNSGEYPELNEIVERCSNKDNEEENLDSKLEALKGSMQRWNRESVRCLEKNLGKSLERLRKSEARKRMGCFLKLMLG
ncbi:hypothetical protein Cni_G16311 [Canna indica]|uniref:CCHC-type domain-containing protein n=1 Tax=Canna indica TaxID=4628 RepID=A0AAQ3KG30_9LILI|nr:hypothetical protein Cni_G16311 [Canna indica]